VQVRAQTLPAGSKLPRTLPRLATKAGKVGRINFGRVGRATILTCVVVVAVAIAVAKRQSRIVHHGVEMATIQFHHLVGMIVRVVPVQGARNAQGTIVEGKMVVIVVPSLIPPSRDDNHVEYVVVGRRIGSDNPESGLHTYLVWGHVGWGQGIVPREQGLNRSFVFLVGYYS